MEEVKGLPRSSLVAATKGTPVPRRNEGYVWKMRQEFAQNFAHMKSVASEACRADDGWLNIEKRWLEGRGGDEDDFKPLWSMPLVKTS